VRDSSHRRCRAGGAGWSPSRSRNQALTGKLKRRLRQAPRRSGSAGAGRARRGIRRLPRPRPRRRGRIHFRTNSGTGPFRVLHEGGRDRHVGRRGSCVADLGGHVRRGGDGLGSAGRRSRPREIHGQDHDRPELLGRDLSGPGPQVNTSATTAMSESRSFRTSEFAIVIRIHSTSPPMVVSRSSRFRLSVRPPSHTAAGSNAGRPRPSRHGPLQPLGLSRRRPPPRRNARRVSNDASRRDRD
jgi:hypothetical protein